MDIRETVSNIIESGRFTGNNFNIKDQKAIITYRGVKLKIEFDFNEATDEAIINFATTLDPNVNIYNLLVTDRNEEEELDNLATKAFHQNNTSDK